MKFTLDDFSNDRLICKHFNLSWDTLRDDIGWGDYYCMLATALDAEEMEKYEFAALTHGKDGVKKWKWSSPDEAGTKPLKKFGGVVSTESQDRVIGSGQPTQAMINFASGLQMLQTGKRGLTANGTAQIFDEGTGRVGYYDKELNILVNSRGEEIVKTEDMIILPRKK